MFKPIFFTCTPLIGFTYQKSKPIKINIPQMGTQQILPQLELGHWHIDHYKTCEQIIRKFQVFYNGQFNRGSKSYWNEVGYCP